MRVRPATMVAGTKPPAGAGSWRKRGWKVERTRLPWASFSLLMLVISWTGANQKVRGSECSESLMYAANASLPAYKGRFIVCRT
ncbi:hypothetical protein KQX54_004605 [Cotesia glomerata]|uniref:Uncharacterized protein n=1 Tax=Cotesia glomerata TaxID=32391 RepID=A0AAV7HYR0_COTGL|nr:hypothetical protein KQX54_004605 [Cotesia glomerata]